MFIKHPPSPALVPFVEGLWYFEADLQPALERVLPTGAMQLLINLDADEMRWYSGADCAVVHRLGGAILAGPFEGPVVIDTEEQRRVAGIAFTPMGASVFLTCPAHTVRGLLVPLEELWGGDGRVLRERLLEAGSPAAMLACLDAWLIARSRDRLVIDPAVVFAVAALGCGARVGTVVERLGLTARRFIDRFEAQVGLTPKRFARIQRFQRLVTSRDGSPDWADLAARAGYADQSHMIRDFTEFSGVPPSGYQPRSARELNHVPLAER